MPDTDDFATAFDEAIGLEEETSDTGRGRAEEGAEGPTSEAPEGETTEQAAETSEVEQEPTEATATEAEGWQSRLQAEEHKRKTLEGMFNSEIKRRQELEAELAALRKAEAHAGEAEKPKAEAPPRTIRADLEAQPEFKALIEDYGDIAEPILKMADHLEEKFNARLQNALLAVMEEIGPTIQTTAMTAKERHFAAIRQAHEDVDSLVASGEVKAWIDELPSFKQEAYLKAFQRGTSGEVIELLSDYKKAKGIARGGDSPSRKRDETKLQGLEAVETRRRPISPNSPGKANKDDFDAAWDEQG